MAGLEEVGIPGPEQLRDALTNCSDPLAAIEEFQDGNSILLPSLKPALPFLDLHGVRRLEFHQLVMEELRDKLLQRISEVAESNEKTRIKTLNELLDKSFPVIKVKTLRPVVMSVMKYLPKIKDSYLSKIMEDKELYDESSVEVKRQIWQDNQALFGDEVSPLLAKYIEDKDASLLSHESAMPAFFTLSPKARRQTEVVQKLTNMVGKNVKLYDMVLQFLRTLFLRTRNIHYCTLRAELLMALHELEIHEITSVDPCHKFTWCLDACIRERFVDTKRSRELQGFLDGVKRGHEQVLGDLSMILCDPYAVNTVSLSLMKILQHCVNTESLPREHPDIILLLRMLALGLGAWDMIDSQLFKEPKLESALITKLLPSIVSMMVDDVTHTVTARLHDEHTSVQTCPDVITAFISNSHLSSCLALYYALQVTRQKDRTGLLRILPTLSNCVNDRAFEDTFLHSLVSYLCTMADEFAQEDFCIAVFDDFFMPQTSRESVLRHMLRLLCYVHHKCPPVRLSAMMKAVEPNNQNSEAAHSTYSFLTEKISSHQPIPAAQPEPTESPLIIIPAPTPVHS